jgi:hypothetical protein
MKLNATLEIDPVDVEKAVVEYIEKKLKRTVKSLSFSLGTRSVGMGTDERDETYFKGCTAKVVLGEEEV